jgi:hypothetical protein
MGGADVNPVILLLSWLQSRDFGCMKLILKIVILICKDAEGFDRTAFHQEFNRSVIALYQSQFAARRPP